MKSQRRYIILALVIASAIAFAFMRRPGSNIASSGWLFGAVIVIILLIGFIIDRVQHWREAQKQALYERAERDGFRVVDDSPERGAFGDIPKEAAHLNVKHAKFRKLVEGPLDEHATARIFQHTYTYSAGQAMITIVHCVGMVKVPDHWPMARIYDRKETRMKFGMWKKLKPIEVESEAFNKRFRVESKDREFAELLADPVLQDSLIAVSSSLACSLFVAEGRLWYMEKGSLTADRFTAFKERLERVVHSIHPELWAPIHAVPPHEQPDAATTDATIDGESSIPGTPTADPGDESARSASMTD